MTRDKNSANILYKYVLIAAKIIKNFQLIITGGKAAQSYRIQTLVLVPNSVLFLYFPRRIFMQDNQ